MDDALLLFDAAEDTAAPRVEVRRSARRRRTVSARMERRDGSDVMVLMIPATATAEQERQWIEDMRAKLQRRARRTPAGDADLLTRARRLATEHDLPEPASVRWVTNQEHRWGSCTPSRSSIRISHRLQTVPGYVLDAVLVHELAHLVERRHGPRFRALEARYPRSERATGYLEALATAAGWSEDEPEQDEVDGG